MAFKGFQFGNGAIREDEWKAIRNVLMTHRRLRTIVEIGAGYSTILLSDFLASNGGGTLVSLEENPTWAAEVTKNLTHGNAYVALYKYPDFRVFEELLLEPDMVFVDGPAGGADGRMSAMGLARALNPKCVFIHDAGRQKERGVIDNVHFGDWTEKKFGSGLSLFYPVY